MASTLCTSSSSPQTEQERILELCELKLDDARSEDRKTAFPLLRRVLLCNTMELCISSMSDDADEEDEYDSDDENTDEEDEGEEYETDEEEEEEKNTFDEHEESDDDSDSDATDGTDSESDPASDTDTDSDSTDSSDNECSSQSSGDIEYDWKSNKAPFMRHETRSHTGRKCIMNSALLNVEFA